MPVLTCTAARSKMICASATGLVIVTSMHPDDDQAFLAHVTDRLAGLPDVKAVALGGSRAKGTHRPDSDWDFASSSRD